VRDARIYALSKVPLFASLSERQLRKVLKEANEDRYDAGVVIVREGGRTQSMFVILEGTAKIIRNGRTIARRSVGDFFGELSVIDGRPRAGTVIAETPMRCVVLGGEDLKKVVMEEPPVAWQMLNSLASMIRENWSR
jgi:CRP/FNR family cyclic AMP-dependent transcriptional regulator